MSASQALRQEQEDMAVCKTLSKYRLPLPRVTVSSIKDTGTLRGGRYNVKGIIAGVCLREAGLYIQGKRVIKFPLKTVPTHKRFEFSLEIKEEDNPEIRAFDIHWRRTSAMLLESLKKKKP